MLFKAISWINALRFAGGCALVVVVGCFVTVAEAQNEKGAIDFPVKVDRDHYPVPEYRYPNAKIGITAADSQPDFLPD